MRKISIEKSILKEEEKTRKPAERQRQRNTLKLWSRLQICPKRYPHLQDGRLRLTISPQER